MTEINTQGRVRKNPHIELPEPKQSPRRWLKLLNPEDFGLPEWVETVRPLSHLAPRCVTYDLRLPAEEEALEFDDEDVRGPVYAVRDPERIWRILRDGQFEEHVELGTGWEAVEDGHCFLDVPACKRIRLDGSIQPARSRGGLDIGEDVVIFPGTVVQRGIFGELTEIGDRVWLENCSVAHSCIIGADSILAAGTVLGGGVEVGEGGKFGVGAIVLPRVKIGDGAQVSAGAVVDRDVPAGGIAIRPRTQISRGTR